MNLFYPSTITDLRQIVDAADKSLPVHNIVIDYDGEVIIDPEMKYTGIKLNRFKFHTCISRSIRSKAKNMQALLETLLAAYQSSGQIVELHGKLKSAA